MSIDFSKRALHRWTQHSVRFIEDLDKDQIDIIEGLSECARFVYSVKESESNLFETWVREVFIDKEGGKLCGKYPHYYIDYKNN